MAEIRHLVPAKERTHEEMVADLDAMLRDFDGSENSDDLRVDVWWDPEDPEVWMRTTVGLRVRWSIRILEEGIEFQVRGPFGIRVRLPTAVRWLVDRLELL